MKNASALTLACCLFAFSGLLPLAHAENFDFNNVLGTHLVKSCQYIQNFEEQPKDYYCNIKSLTLEKSTKDTFTLKYVDELNQTVAAQTFEQYQRKSNSITDEAKFINDDNFASWERNYTDTKSNTEIYDTFEFKLDNEGHLFIRHAYSYSTDEITKFYTWDYVIK